MSYESVERKEINLRHNDTRSHACGDCSREDSDIDKKEKDKSEVEVLLGTLKGRLDDLCNITSKLEEQLDMVLVYPKEKYDTIATNKQSCCRLESELIYITDQIEMNSCKIADIKKRLRV